MLAPTPKEMLFQDKRIAAHILLVRHGQPEIALKPVTCHRGFQSYIRDYEESGLDPSSLPPADLRAKTLGIRAIFTSGRRRSEESAQSLAPHAKMIANALFAEAPLASPPIPFLRMTVSKWAVVSRLLWHLGFHPSIESPRVSRQRVGHAADVLIAEMEHEGIAVLVAHGYFNFLLGRELQRRGFGRNGIHLAQYWNVVDYRR